MIPGPVFRQWMASDDMEILGFVYSMFGDSRFRAEPGLSLDEYVKFVRLYYERCFTESPEGVVRQQMVCRLGPGERPCFPVEQSGSAQVRDG